MAERSTIADIRVALDRRMFPTITLWNRLEGRPRTAEFDRALAAEVRDPLWMLSRQWQLGEYRGDDAGSPVAAKVHIAKTRLTKFQPADHAVREFSDAYPMEGQVERRPIPFRLGGQAISLDLRIVMGRQWLRMLDRAVGDFSSEYRARYPIPVLDPEQATSAPVVAHLEAWQQWSAVAGRMMDGYALYRYLRDPGHHAWDGTSVPAHRQAEVDVVAERFMAWFDDLFYQPETEDDHAWRMPHLEYQFGCSAPDAAGEKVYGAEEYYHGRLDWYNLDQDTGSASLGAPTVPRPPADPPVTQSFLPVQLAYDGMPNSRWWTFEDRKVNLGDVTPNTTDLGALLFLEFGLVYANDWFLIPQALPAGSIATVRGLAVTNVFGERTWIQPSGMGADDDWQRWAMFVVSIKGQDARSADPSLMLLPVVPKTQEGPPLEDLSLVRDEMANMVWGVETRILLPAGGSKQGVEAGRETYAFHRRLVERALETGALSAPEVEYKASVRYQVMNSVPENWIPFVPVHVSGDNRQIQLQRAAMPRIIAGDSRVPAKVEPRTSLLRDGLDLQPRRTYFLHEEEVPRAGARLFQSFQRTRWYGGKVVTWLGVRKQTGRGEGSSGLIFDAVVPVKNAAPEE
jgi:hypothetical protein